MSCEASFRNQLVHHLKLSPRSHVQLQCAYRGREGGRAGNPWACRRAVSQQVHSLHPLTDTSTQSCSTTWEEKLHLTFQNWCPLKSWRFCTARVCASLQEQQGWKCSSALARWEAHGAQCRRKGLIAESKSFGYICADLCSPSANAQGAFESVFPKFRLRVWFGQVSLRLVSKKQTSAGIKTFKK